MPKKYLTTTLILFVTLMGNSLATYMKVKISLIDGVSIINRIDLPNENVDCQTEIINNENGVSRLKDILQDLRKILKEIDELNIAELFPKTLMNEVNLILLPQAYKILNDNSYESTLILELERNMRAAHAVLVENLERIVKNQLKLSDDTKLLKNSLEKIDF